MLLVWYAKMKSSEKYNLPSINSGLGYWLSYMCYYYKT